jgi:ribosome-binding ATPase YchF (GTP1/OBG family)
VVAVSFNLRDCDALVHVVRIFEDQSVILAEGATPDTPYNDINTIHAELIFADIAHVERRLEKTNVSPEERSALEKVVDGMINKDLPARSAGLSQEDEKSIRSMGLLTLKPIFFVFNVDEADYLLDRTQIIEHIIPQIMAKVEYNMDNTDPWTVVSSKLEGELSQLNGKEQKDYLESLGVDDTDSILMSLSHNTLPTMIMKHLDMKLVFTGPGVPPERSKTTRAHLFYKGKLTAAGLAGRIH